MKTHIALILIVAAALMSGCVKKEDSTGSAEFKALLLASGGSYFERELPDDLKETDWIYVALAYPNGEIEQLLGMSEQGIKFTSDTVKIYFFEDKFSNEPFVAMQVSEGTMGQGGIAGASKKNWKAKTEGKKHGELSEPMIRFSTNNSISSIGGTEIPEGCFDLILYIDPNQPKS